MSLHAVKVKGRFYILKDITKNGKHSTTTVEKLGTAEEIMAAHSCDDAMEWARQRALELDMKDREASDPEGRHYILARDNVRIPKGALNSFNVGYLPLQKIYYDLRMPSICNAISKRHSFDFDLDTIFSRLIYSQILFPGSKLRVTDLSRRLFEHPDFEYHQVLRALSVISEHFDEIQSSLYKNSLKVIVILSILLDTVSSRILPYVSLLPDAYRSETAECSLTALGCPSPEQAEMSRMPPARCLFLTSQTGLVLCHARQFMRPVPMKRSSSVSSPEVESRRSLCKCVCGSNN